MKLEALEVLSDIPGYDMNGQTIPQDILVTSGEGSRPDLVLVNRREKHIWLIELTCCFERNEDAAHVRKTNKYTGLKHDLEDRGYIVHLVPFEVGARGHVTRNNTNNMINILIKNSIKIMHTNYVRTWGRFLYYVHLLYFMHTSNQHG